MDYPHERPLGLPSVIPTNPFWIKGHNDLEEVTITNDHATGQKILIIGDAVETIKLESAIGLLECETDLPIRKENAVALLHKINLIGVRFEETRARMQGSVINRVDLNSVGGTFGSEAREHIVPCKGAIVNTHVVQHSPELSDARPGL